MKKYHIFIAVLIGSTILSLGIPQFMGHAFVDNRNAKNTKDWLSAQLIKSIKVTEEQQYAIPDHIQTILVRNVHPAKRYTSYIEISKDTTQRISYYSGAPIFYISGDTLTITNTDDYTNIFNFYIDSTQRDIIFENVVGTVEVHQRSPLNFSVLINSDITIIGKRNTQLHQMIVKDQSVLSISQCFTSKMDINAENGMVYIDPQNAIDSIHVHLTGKSNIKVKSPSRYVPNLFEKLMKEFQIESPHFQIYATGDTQYYDRMKK